MVTNNVLEDKMGGLERYVRELSSVLARRGHDVTIVAKRWRRETHARERCADGVTLERHPVPSKRNPFYAPLYPLYTAAGVHMRARRRGPGVVLHAHMGLPALPLAATGKPYLFTFHAPVWRELLGERHGTYALPGLSRRVAVGSLRRAERFAATRARATVVLSEFMRSELAALDPCAADRATLIPGGIDLGRFSPGLSSHRWKPGEPPTLFTARRLSPRTGVDELVRAMAIIRRRWPGARLDIAGTGGMESELRTIAAESDLGNDVRFLGRISDSELVARYRSATLVVMPTRELEGFGLTTAEALACGAAVVGTPAGATPELLLPLDPALVAADVSACRIAVAVMTLLDQPERIEAVRTHARERVALDMSWDKVADRYTELYEQLT